MLPVATRRLLARSVLFLPALCFAVAAAAQLPVPSLSGRVVDQTGTLKPDQTTALVQTLQAFEARKGSQIAVLIVPTTAPEAIEQYSLRVVEQWKLGRKKVDDGVLLLIARDDRALRIEVGYGLEGALNDATAKRIVSEIIAPYFKQQDFYGGITSGVEQIIRVVDGEPLPAPGNQSGSRPANGSSAGGDDLGQYAPVLFILAMVAGGILRTMFGRLPGALVTGGVVALLAWFLVGALAIALIAGVIALVLTLMGGGIGGRGLGGFTGGGFGGGGGSGGGFSGGGGGFGGGGASGKW